jgi:hypothetical protein
MPNAGGIPKADGAQQIFLHPGESLDAGWYCGDFDDYITAVATAYSLEGLCTKIR